ncbi:MAG: acyltransferase [Phyllobacteriaceae bacterium]|nr:acyltransferase [Phyllobacteriaceae bacterium]MBA92183.1 acyltransferase [Phyllobacteriaceae bacterium]
MPFVMKYRSEIDGLRAFAVVPVILFHAGASVFSGGYAGVDVFFVISGYLIAGILIDDMEAGRFSIWRFYERRIRRIAPALAVVVMACIPFAWMWMFPSDFKYFGLAAGAAAISLSNFVFWQRAGYFDTAAELKPLLHTWSLGVEEQFYLLFPLLLLAFWRLGWRRFGAILLAICVVSLILAEATVRRWPDAAFYLPHTRIWELGAGVLCAIAERKTRLPNIPLAGLAGLLAVALSMVMLGRSTPWPSLWTLLPVGGTALVILFARAGTPAARILSFSPFVWIGLVSYSAYLWHQPLFAFARIRSAGDPPAWIMAALCAATFILAFASWRYVEKPFRNPASRLYGNRRTVFAGAGVAIALFAGFGLTAIATEGLPGRLPPDLRELATLHARESAALAPCRLLDPAVDIEARTCVFGQEGKPPAFGLLGDSHAMGIARTLGAKLGEQGAAMRQLTYPGCMPVLGLRRAADNNRCVEFNQGYADYLEGDGTPETLIILAHWALYVNGIQYDNGEGGKARGPEGFYIPVDEPDNFRWSPNRLRALQAALDRTIRRHLDAGKRVALVYPVPEAGWDVPAKLGADLLNGVRNGQSLSTSYERFLERVRPVHALFDAVPADPGLIRIRPEEVFCDMQADGRCQLVLDGKPAYHDEHHLSGPGADLLSGHIVRRLKEKGWL